MTPTIRITVDGKLSLTTEQIAAEFDLQPASARKELQRLGQEPTAHLGRMPLYPAATTRKALKARPGKGANLRRKT